jgi:hypothetical protein
MQPLFLPQIGMAGCDEIVTTFTPAPTPIFTGTFIANQRTELV